MSKIEVPGQEKWKGDGVKGTHPPACLGFEMGETGLQPLNIYQIIIEKDIIVFFKKVLISDNF